MDEVVICDTNAVIQLAIICPQILTNKGNGLDLVVHPKVIQEVTGLKRNPEKYKRLGTELDFITSNVIVSKEYSVPEEEEYKEMDETIGYQECGLPLGMKSAPTTATDRFFLILAQCNNLKLLTREGTLFSLGRAILSIDQAWGISDALVYAIDYGLVTRQEVEEGIRKLDKKEETLPERCIEHLTGYIKI